MSQLPLDKGVPLLAKRARRARGALYAYFGVLPFCMLATATEIAGLVDTTAVPDIGSMVALAILLVTLAVMIVTMVLVAMWIYRAHANLKFTRAQGPTMDPSWAVGWYFIPIANLVKPFDAMRQLWTRSGTNAIAGQRVGVLNIWWGAWILANILSNASVLPSNAPDVLRNSPWLSMISDGLMMIAAWLLAKIIAAITDAQKSNMGLQATFG